MTFVVPFDGSRLAEAALVRANEYADAFDAEVVVIVVVPESRHYAVRRGWIDEGEEFSPRAIVGSLHERATELAPECSFESKRIDGTSPGGIANIIRRRAREHAADVVFVGSDEAGRIVVSLTSVGGSVAADAAYDVHIVRRKRPPRLDRVPKRSEFYLEG